jgi:hypothetical protein
MTPYFNFQIPAPISVLAFLGTGAALVCLGIAFVVLAMAKSWFAAKRVAMVGGGLGAAYLATLAGMSLASRTQVVQPGDAKYFCEIDCHLAYSVVGAQRVDALGSARPHGAFEVVTLKVWFDPSTISPHRGEAPLTPNPRFVRLLDARGEKIGPSAEGGAALASAQGAQTPLSTPLRPGESYTTSLVFDVPRGDRADRLLLTEDDPVTALLIGHENSLLHPKVVFRLSGAPSASTVHG